ncbi:MAG: protein kinase domain-containing protein, partial [Terriglobales bacterium]
MAVAPLRTGQTLGHYRVLEPIGAGGMGVVYRALDERLDRDVALKVLPLGTLTDEIARKRFRKEALTLSRLNHPNIGTIHDFDMQDGVDFLVMEYVSGQTLAELLRTGPLPEKEVVRLGMEIAGALEEAHENGIIHRDLKPGNIMVTSKRRVKVLDFGLAKLLPAVSETAPTESISLADHAAGTLPYMAPEQLRSGKVDVRSDIWAAGAVLYEMVTGRRPFDAVSSAALAGDILYKEPSSPRLRNPELSSRLEDVILKCLGKDPEIRYQSVKDLGVDLRRIGAVEGGTAPSPPRRTGRRIVLAATGAILAVALAVLISFHAGKLREWLAGGTAGPEIRSLAVLPLENLSGDPEQEYFADGMTDALIANLAKIGSLKVISRTSVMQYKSVRKPLPEIGRELGVDAVVEGSVLRSGDRVRITAQLIHAPTDRHLWAESYEREMRDVLSLQSDVAHAVAREIRITLSPQDEARFSPAAGVNPEAYQAYLKGRYHWNQRTEDGFRKGLKFFQQAITIDPGYAPAYAGLSDSYLLFAGYGLLPDREARPLAKAAAIKALELDPNLAEAHTSLAGVVASYEWDWQVAEREFQRALELNPNYATARFWYGSYLLGVGRPQEAIVQMRKARELDPLSPVIHTYVGFSLHKARQFDQAIEEHRKTLSLFPDFGFAHWALAMTYVQKRLYKDAIHECENAYRLQRRTMFRATQAHAYAVSGKRAEAVQILEELKTASRQSNVPGIDLAVVYMGLGDREQTLVWLEKAYQDRF